MKFDPLTEQEINEISLVPDGAYQYQVTSAEDKISKASNAYLSLKLKIWDKDGKEHNILTNLALIKLLKHFCDVNKLQDQYKAGELTPHHCLGMCGGKVIISTELEKPKPDGGVYPAKNVVRDYIAKAVESNLQPLKPNDDFADKDLPF